MTALHRRLDTLEAKAASPSTGCKTCKHWPGFMVRFRDDDGGYQDTGFGVWPASAICPDCGRECPKTISIAQDDGQ